MVFAQAAAVAAGASDDRNTPALLRAGGDAQHGVVDDFQRGAQAERGDGVEMFLFLAGPVVTGNAHARAGNLASADAGHLEGLAEDILQCGCHASVTHHLVAAAAALSETDCLASLVGDQGVGLRPANVYAEEVTSDPSTTLRAGE